MRDSIKLLCRCGPARSEQSLTGALHSDGFEHSPKIKTRYPNGYLVFILYRWGIRKGGTGGYTGAKIESWRAIFSPWENPLVAGRIRCGCELRPILRLDLPPIRVVFLFLPRIPHPLVAQNSATFSSYLPVGRRMIFLTTCKGEEMNVL